MGVVFSGTHPRVIFALLLEILPLQKDEAQSL